MNPMPHEETLFQAALPLAGTERAAFLDRECAGDPALRARLDALLAAHEQPGTLLGTEAGAARPTISLDLAHDLADDLVGQTIGRYKLREKIGEGGCGVVYVAEQTEPLRRRVALKIIKLGMDTQQVVARFEAERQALAMMDHPNIAKVLDAGATDGGKPEIRRPKFEASPKSGGSSKPEVALDPLAPSRASEAARTAGSPLPSDGRGVGSEGFPASPPPSGDTPLSPSRTPTGRPYFVMELVRGIKITDYCDQEQLSTRDRLDLFIKVCHAIQHAHQKGIIHRDIKPSNILVTLHDGVPVPKVIDFGIAKAVEGRLTDATVYTQLHQFLGTPAYMSPEQAEMSGLDIDTRSDIYSLGVLLYELLTGVTPFDANELMSQGIDAMRWTIREKEPVRPSTRLTQLRQEERSQSPIANSRGRAAQARAKSEIRNQRSDIETDLDWIVMKCLEKDRGRRYETANGLLADLQRHLDNEPVVARPPSAVYRFQKSFRRHKLAFAAGLAVALALIGGLGASLWQAAEAKRAWKVAEAARASESGERLAADAARKQAEEESARASSALDRESKALAEAQRANQTLEEALRKERQTAYLRGINLAYQESFASNPDRVLEILEACGPEPLRSFEWYFLRSRAETRGSSGVGVRILAHHKQGVWTVAFSPDGQRLISSSEDGDVAIWSPLAEPPLVTLRGHEGPVFGAAFSPVDDRVATGGKDGTVRIWDSRTGELLCSAHDNEYWVSTVAYSPDGALLASAGADGIVRVRNGHSGEFLSEFRGHKEGPARGAWPRYATTVVFSPHGQDIASAGADQRVRIWNVANREERLTLVHAGWVHCVAYRPDGRVIAACSRRGTVVLWSAETGKEMHYISVSEPGRLVPRSVAFSPDGKRLAISSGASVRLFDTASGLEILTLPNSYPGGPRGYEGVAFSPDGRFVAAGGLDGKVRVWDAGQTPLNERFQEFAEALNDPATRPQARARALREHWEALARVEREAEARGAFLRTAIPSRQPDTPSTLIDLSDHYSASLNEVWHLAGSTLGDLPTGRRRFAGVEFDVRGLVQLGTWRRMPEGDGDGDLLPIGGTYPSAVGRILVQRRCAQLHFLHAAICAASTPAGTAIGLYTVRYADGRSRQLPIGVGFELTDWRSQPNEVGKPLTIAWTGGNERTRGEGRWLRLFKTTWENPTPQIEVRSLDFTTESRQASPFLVALTAE